MIFRGLVLAMDDFIEGFMMLACFIGIFCWLAIAGTIDVFGVWYFLLFLFILTEILYHIEPRSKEDKKKGRGYFRVFYKKLDSAFSASLLMGISTGVYTLVRRITLEHITGFLKSVGLIVVIIIALIVYLWINRLRDRPKKKVTKTKKGKKKR